MRLPIKLSVLDGISIVMSARNPERAHIHLRSIRQVNPKCVHHLFPNRLNIRTGMHSYSCWEPDASIFMRGNHS